MKFEPNNESLKAHVIPDWYHDAKLGIFVHWGIYSVPAYAEPGNEVIKLNNMNYAEMPYAEWYFNKLRIKGSSTEKYHAEKYGKNFSYYDFAREFEAHTENFNADGWAELFQQAGAKYVVLTTKHHDGYLLWPSKYKNANIDNYYSTKDLVGEIACKVRAKGLKMGLYYSGVLDWTYNKQPIINFVAQLENLRQSQEYINYATNHYFELIERYKPSILWNDIGYPYGYELTKLFAYYYNTIPEGVINNRWNQSKISKILINPITKKPLNALITFLLKRMETEKFFESEDRKDLHTDFKTPEYVTYKEIKPYKFEVTRGIGHSFAYNFRENESHMLTGKELIHMLIDIVSKNGNLLINVGPMADGTIPDMQKKPLLEMGRWLKTSGEAIYGTRPWIHAEGRTEDGREIRFTKNQSTLYAVILDKITPGHIKIKGVYLQDSAKITLLGAEGDLKWIREGDGISIEMPEISALTDDLKQQCAFTFRIENGVL